MSSEPIEHTELKQLNSIEPQDILSLLCDTTVSGHYYPKEYIQSITRSFRKTNPHVIEAFNFHRNQFWVYFFANVTHSQQESTMEEIARLILNHLSSQNYIVSTDQLNKVFHAIPGVANSNSEIVLH